MGEEVSKSPQKVKENSHHLKLRHLTRTDYGDVAEIMKLVYTSGRVWPQASIEQFIEVFSDGQICVEDNGRVVAVALTLIVNYEELGDNHSYDDIVGDGKFSSHNADGETLYGVDAFVHPEFQNLRLGRRLYDARKELCENLNLRAIVVGSNLPGYAENEPNFSVGMYIEKVKKKELYDAVLTFQLANDFHVRRVLRNYKPKDNDSSTYTLLEWNNIYYEKEASRLIGRPKAVIRAGLVQMQMRPLNSHEQFLEVIEYFVDAISSHNSDFVLFPELFNAPLMALSLNSKEENAVDALVQLAGLTDSLVSQISALAVSYNINIIAGSMPVLKDDKLYNSSFLLRRDGTFASQPKLHISKEEHQYWGIHGGDKLSVFETDMGKVGILIGYDVEFPELGRILADQGVDIIFVPYLTDTQNAYLRVRRCAQARAIENEVYVAMTGSCGNLPNVENMEIQHSQAAIFTPSDFAFAHDAVAAQAATNTEVTLVADLDLDLLKELRAQGSVTNRKDRRGDLYRVEYNK